jgi:formate hydrogenlyase transcriptional activator
VTTLAESEKGLIEAALAESRGRISGPLGAAAKLGIPRQTLESKIKSLHIDKHSFRGHQTGSVRELFGARRLRSTTGSR